MGKHKQLGRIEKKPVREYWENEASDFTPWLADNINLLGEALGLDGLEVEEQESSVGDFRVDLLCKDENDRTVIIENQLEKTNHRHLGQLLTYAAGKGAGVVVWVSTNFTDEHRAALDWMNDKTEEGVQFFGVQIEVWQIGDSAAAPKLEVVCKPNEWSKTVQHSGEMSNAQKLRFDYWSGLREHMLEKGGKIAAQPPMKRMLQRFSIGVKWFHLRAVIHVQKDVAVVRLFLRGPVETQKAHYHLLHQQKDEIEKEIGAKLKWLEFNPAGKPVQVIRLLRENCNLRDRKNWSELHQWHHEHLEKFYAAFHQRIKNLNGQ